MADIIFGKGVDRKVITAGVGGGVTDHGALTGLTDNDHPQYQLTTGKDAASGYAGLDASSKLTGSQQVYGAAANTACQGNDSRLSDSRTPTAHAASHASGGADQLAHTALASIGTNTHAQIDTHLAASAPHAGHELTANKNAASGYAGLSAASKIAAAQMTGVLASSDLTNDAALEKTANKNANNGYAGLDANGRVTLARIVDLSANRVLGRITTGGAVTELTGTETTALLDAFTSVLKGLVPASGGGTTRYLRADGSWQAPPNSGTLAQYNQSVAAQGGVTSGGGFAADTYLTGSSIAIPSGSLKAGSRYRLRMNLVKGAFGAGSIVLNVRFGTLGTTSDTARATLTFPVQTGVADEGDIEVWVTFRAVGASGVIQAVGRLAHRLTTTGLTNAGAVSSQIATSGTFDTSVASSIIGVSMNGGASGAIQTQLVQAELENLS